MSETDQRQRKRRSLLQVLRRVLVSLFGFPIFVSGVIMLPLPPPFAFGIILIPVGLIILSFEFPFAIRLLEWFEDHTWALGRNMRRLRHKAEEIARRIAKREEPGREEPKGEERACVGNGPCVDEEASEI